MSTQAKEKPFNLNSVLLLLNVAGLMAVNGMLHWRFMESNINQLTVTIIGVCAGIGLLHARDHKHRDGL